MTSVAPSDIYIQLYSLNKTDLVKDKSLPGLAGRNNDTHAYESSLLQEESEDYLLNIPLLIPGRLDKHHDSQ